MKKVCWPYFDPEFDNLPERIYGPPCRVCIDNERMEDCTVIKVDSVNKQGILLEVVQVLTNINLTILKSYISADAGWFMDVFHVKDEHGNKLKDQKVINYIQQAIGTIREIENTVKACSNGVFNNAEQSSEHTAIEMSGTDRPGLFSEISAALADLHCNIVEAHAWSHNARLACVAYISDQSTDTPIDDPYRLATIEDHLTTVLRATSTTAIQSGSETASPQEVKTAEFLEGTNMTDVERRLHQLMLSVGDFDTPPFGPMSPSSPSRSDDDDEEGRKTLVSIENCHEKWYSIVSIECKDRPRLMFDTVCTLTDMQYVIFHASISSGEGVRLELSAENRGGLLSDITRVLRENGLTVVRADVETQGEKAVNSFYVRDISGNDVDMDFVESVKKEMDVIDLKVKINDRASNPRPSSPQRSPGLFCLGDVLRSQIERFSHNFISIN
ncbi:hypothetical protein CRYUN_Cryun02cG0062700 [Craigia yunnanensis]